MLRDKDTKKIGEIQMGDCFPAIQGEKKLGGHRACIYLLFNLFNVIFFFINYYNNSGEKKKSAFFMAAVFQSFPAFLHFREIL